MNARYKTADNDATVTLAVAQNLLRDALPAVLAEYGISVSKKQPDKQGSMSSVWNARKGKKQLIVKCVIIDRDYRASDYVSAQKALEQDNLRAFNKEYRALELLENSPYCVHLSPFKPIGTEQYFEIELSDRFYARGFLEPKYAPFMLRYLQGGIQYTPTVNRWCRKYGADFVAAWLGYCITAGMLHMHTTLKEHGAEIVAHRDIKTANILIDMKDPRDPLKNNFVLADFGIAHIEEAFGEVISPVEPPSPEKQETEPPTRKSDPSRDTRNIVIGTACYRPKNDTNPDWRFDQYMLGKALCEFYGVLVCLSDSSRLLGEEFWKGEFRENRYGMQTIVRKMIEENAEDRFNSLEELNRQFAGVLNAIRPGCVRNGRVVMPSFKRPTRKKPKTGTKAAGQTQQKRQSGQSRIYNPTQTNPSSIAMESAQVLDAKNLLRKTFRNLQHALPDELPAMIESVTRYITLHAQALSSDLQGYLYRAAGILYYLNDDYDKAISYFQIAKNRQDPVSRFFLLNNAGKTSTVRDFKVLYLEALAMTKRDEKLIGAISYALKQYGKRACLAENIRWENIRSYAEKVDPLELACSLPF